ncbi:MAG TPA: MarR family transcriptional regulator [Gemmatimonadaceae bacterium]|nr:MarR family transcriptional regulator [Gemmatimonadaceae bacterium]
MEARAITRIFEARLRPHGLRATQFSVLAVLAQRGTIRLKELARILDLERTTLTRIAGLLERRGLVETTPSPDARERPLAITLAGRRALADALPSWREAQEAVDRRLAASPRGRITSTP